MEHGITGDFALVKGWKADKAGNVTFRYDDMKFMESDTSLRKKLQGKPELVEIEKGQNNNRPYF